MRKRVLLAFVAAVLGTLPGLAGESLLVRLMDGTEVVCSLSKEPQMVFGEKTITLTSQEGAVGQWTFTDIDYWKFVDVEEDAIVIARTEKPVVRISSDELLIAGANARSMSVHDLSGRQRTTSLTMADGTVRVSLKTLPRGTYLLKVGDNSMKLVVR